MKVSILCITCNRPEFYKFLLWNYHKQTFPDKELIVVDGSDRSNEQLFKAPGIRYFHMPSTVGIPIKRNRALNEATGDMITWFDDDDWQHPDKCTLLHNALTNGHRIAGCKKALFYNLSFNGWRLFLGQKLIFNSLGILTEQARSIRFDESKQKASDMFWCNELFKENQEFCTEIKNVPLFFWVCHEWNISNPARWRMPDTEIDTSVIPVTSNELTFISQLLPASNPEHKQESRSLPVNLQVLKKTGVRPNGLSVIVAVRNRSGNHVQNFLKTLRNQVFSYPYEIIMVDSFSQEPHSSSLKQLSSMYLVRYIRLTEDHIWNKPLALNVGIKMSRYKYCLLTDIDMLFQNNFLKELFTTLDYHNGTAIVHCQSKDLPQFALEHCPDVVSEFLSLEAIAKPHSKMGNGACFGSTYDWLEKVHGLDERMVKWGSMDNDISDRAVYDGMKVVWLSTTTFLHQWHVNKRTLSKEDSSIALSWRKNRELRSAYKTAWETGKQLWDQIIRNNNGWGKCEYTESEMPVPLEKSTRYCLYEIIGLSEKVQNNTFTHVKSMDSIFTELKDSSKFQTSYDVSLSINSCIADHATIGPIIKHVKKQLQISFKHIVVFADFTPFCGKYKGRNYNFEMSDRYRAVLDRMVEESVIDAFIEVDKMDRRIKSRVNSILLDKSDVGSPTFSYIASMLLPESEYIVRMDSDMLFYSSKDHKWIENGINYLRHNEKCLFYMTTPGPYCCNPEKMQSFRKGVQLINNYARYSTATTRYFLFDKNRFLKYCPIPVTNPGVRFELLLSEFLKNNNLYRICEFNNRSFHIHSNASTFGETVDLLKQIIDCIEGNRIPAEQIGKYNLIPEAWLRFLNNRVIMGEELCIA